MNLEVIKFRFTSQRNRELRFGLYLGLRQEMEKKEQDKK